MIGERGVVSDTPQPSESDEIVQARICSTTGCELPAEFYWHDAGPFGAGTFYGCAAHSAPDAEARAERMYDPGYLDIAKRAQDDAALSGSTEGASDGR